MWNLPKRRHDALMTAKQVAETEDYHRRTSIVGLLECHSSEFMQVEGKIFGLMRFSNDRSPVGEWSELATVGDTYKWLGY